MAEDPLTTILTTNNTRKRITQYRSEHDPEIRLNEAGKDLDDILDPKSAALALLDNFKAVTINEFDNGVLMCDALPDQQRTFAIEMMRKLKTEYACQTFSEMATCEQATMAYTRILTNQQLMLESEQYQKSLSYGHTCGANSRYAQSINRHNVEGCCACNRARIEQQHYQTLGKELDRANRIYHSAIQALRMMKQAPLNITIKAQTAIVGHNQMIQSNNHE
jgi:hypothetical protein